MTVEEIFNLIPKPDGVVFSLLKVDKVTTPHPYCLGVRHVSFASDRYCGRLSEECIREGKKEGIHCMVGGCNLSFDEHVIDTILFIKVPQNKDLNNVGGLHDYLLKINDEAQKLGITGYAFPT